MAWLGLKRGVAGWKAQTNPLSYGGHSTNEKIADRNTEIANRQRECPLLTSHC